MSETTGVYHAALGGTDDSRERVIRVAGAVFVAHCRFVDIHTPGWAAANQENLNLELRAMATGVWFTLPQAAKDSYIDMALAAIEEIARG